MVTWDFDSGDSVGVSAKDSVIAYKKLADARPRNAMALNHDTIDGTSRSVVPQVRPFLHFFPFLLPFHFFVLRERMELMYVRDGRSFRTF